MDTCGNCNKAKDDVEMRMFDSGSAVGMRRLCESCFTAYIEKTGFSPISNYTTYCGSPQHTAHLMVSALNKNRSAQCTESEQHWVLSLVKWAISKVWK